MAEKIYLKQMLHTPDNNPIEVAERNPGVFRPCVKDPDMEELVGSINDEPVTSPTAEEASALGLLRGLLAAIQAQAGGADLADLAALLTAINQKDIANQTTAAAILTALQGVLNVNLNGSLGEKQLHVKITGSITANTEETIYDSGDGVPITLDYLEWSTNEAVLTTVRIMPYVNGVPTSIAVIKNDGSGEQGLYAAQIKDHCPTWVDVAVYDTSGSKYKFGIKDMKFPNGVKIMRKNLSSTDQYNLAVLFQGREMDAT